MTLFDSILAFMKDPGNSWILYSISAFMIIEAFMLNAAGKKILRMKKNYMDMERDETSPESDNTIRGELTSAITIAAKLSALFGFILACLTLYFSKLM